MLGWVDLSEKKKAEKAEKFDVLSHELVPKHILLNEDEAKQVLDRYRIKPYQLPYIKLSDPAARALKAKPGDIIKIIRRSPTAGEAIAYRYVIEQ
jgi:DNA-directed RNA polymerase subunit H